MKLLLNVHIPDLIEGCKKRDPECQKKLFEVYYGKMMGICFRYCGSNRDETQDVVQEGFIKLFDRIDKFNDTGSFDNWIRRFFINVALDQLRKKKVQFISMDQDDYHHELEDQEETASRETEWVELLGREKILEEIRNLPPVYRSVFNMYVFEGFTHREIAEELGISEGTSKSNLSKAKAKLRKELQKVLNRKHAS